MLEREWVGQDKDGGMVSTLRPFIFFLGACLNSLTRSGACTPVAGSQDASLSGYPFHSTRYSRLRAFPTTLSSSMRSTSYSGSPSITSGGGREYNGPFMVVSCAGVRSEAWKTGWMFQRGGKVNLYATGLTISETLNGP